MFIESGIVIFLGLLLLFMKLKKVHRKWLIDHSLALDLTVAIIAYALHWGTFTGVMAAAVAGLMCSAFTACAKRWDDANGSIINFLTGGEVDASVQIS